MIGEIPNVVRKTQGSREYYFGTIKSDKVRNITFVPVVEHSKKTYLNERTHDGYQRPGSQSRMRAFMRFLKDNPDSFVPPVLLSARGGWAFKAEAGGEVGSITVNEAAAIIDGQHRLGGYVALFDEHEEVRDVPFVVLVGLDLKQETSEFIIVNNSQKGVPKSLTAYLEDSDEAQIAWQLTEDVDSPFAGTITRTSMQKQHLFALHSVARAMKRLFGIGAIQDLDIEKKVEIASKFFTIVADALPDQWSDIERLRESQSGGRSDFQFKLLELTGLIAWSTVGAHILSRSYSTSSGVNWDNVKRLVEAVANIDWNKEGQYAGRTGEAGARVIADDMLRQLPPDATGVPE